MPRWNRQWFEGHQFGRVGHETGVRELGQPFPAWERGDSVRQVSFVQLFVKQRRREFVVDSEFPDEFGVDVPNDFFVGPRVQRVAFDLFGEVNDQLECQGELPSVRNHLITDETRLHDRGRLVDNQVHTVILG